jgi:hypothetical protein
MTGHVTAIRPGHGHNTQFVKQLAERFLSPVSALSSS